MDVESVAQMLTIPFFHNGETNSNVGYVRFDQVSRLKEAASQNAYLDVVAFRVADSRGSCFKNLLSRAVKLPPLGSWFDDFVKAESVRSAIDHRESLPLSVIGYPNSGTGTCVDYPDAPGAIPNIVHQHATFSGDLRLSVLDHCSKLENLTWSEELSGFSGSPVFAQFANKYGKQFALVGMIICGASRVAHFIRVSTLVKAT